MSRHASPLNRDLSQFLTPSPQITLKPSLLPVIQWYFIFETPLHTIYSVFQTWRHVVVHNTMLYDGFRSHISRWHVRMYQICILKLTTNVRSPVKLTSKIILVTLLLCVKLNTITQRLLFQLTESHHGWVVFVCYKWNWLIHSTIINSWIRTVLLLLLLL